MVVGEFTQETDLVVIGGGPAGYSAAFRAAQLGVQTTLVDSRKGAAGAGSLGGVCLHEGCIPSKTLLHIAETIHLAEHAAQFGVTLGKPKVDPKAVKAWVEKTIKKLSAGLDSLAKKHGVDCVEGRAHFEDSRNLAVLDGSTPRIRFKRAVIATGSVQKAHPELSFDGTHVLTPHEAVSSANLSKVPKAMLIAGSDYLAAELAMIFSALGSIVTLALEHDRILHDLDADLVRPLHKRLGEIATVLPHCRPKLVDAGKKGALVDLMNEREPALFETVIVSAGHLGNTCGLQLEKTQVKVDGNEFIPVDEHLRTGDPRIFAAGDVVGGTLLADKALGQGRVAAEVIAGKSSVFDARAIPSAIFTDPQVAWCGLMEEDAKRQAVNCAVVKMPWGASGRAVGMGRADGMTKIVYDPASQLVLGVGMVGAGACEMIGEASLAIEMGAVLTDLADTLHPHPTISEMLAESARSI